jgi:hypothetical protein
MPQTVTLEQRVATIEKEVAELKNRVHRSEATRAWYEKMIGSMKDYPEFEEVVRLGREIRKADLSR